MSDFKSALIIPQPSAQGLHLDPLEHGPPNLLNWVEDQKAAWFSSEMDLFRECLRIGDLDVRMSVLDDLSNYYRLSAEECRLRCLRWEEWSVREWQEDVARRVKACRGSTISFNLGRSIFFGTPIFKPAATASVHQCWLHDLPRRIALAVRCISISDPVSE